MTIAAFFISEAAGKILQVRLITIMGSLHFLCVYNNGFFGKQTQRR